MKMKIFLCLLAMVVLGMMVATGFHFVKKIETMKMPQSKVETNCEAWFESKGTGASIECPELDVALIVRGKNCRYALQNGRSLKLRCNNLEVSGEIK